jgi:hypothetical protein
MTLAGQVDASAPPSVVTSAGPAVPGLVSRTGAEAGRGIRYPPDGRDPVPGCLAQGARAAVPPRRARNEAVA